MKSLKAFLAALTLTMLLPLAAAQADNLQDYEQMVEDINAVQAMAIANQWKWTRDDITSHVTPQEVIFEFPDGKVKKVALPADKMVVAIAPWLTYTHG